MCGVVEEGGEDARGRVVGRATSPLNKKVVEGAFSASRGRVGLLFGAIGLLKTAPAPVTQRDIVFGGVISAFLIRAVTEIESYAYLLLDHPLRGNPVGVVGEPLPRLTSTLRITGWGSGIGAAPEGRGETDLFCRSFQEALDLGPVIPRHVRVFAGVEEILDDDQAVLPVQHI